MSNSVYKLFNRGVKWNAFEGITYQSLLTSHQIILFSVTGCLIYGLIGVLFSILYLSILFFNFGFDKSLATFFPLFTKNKELFKKIFVIQLLIQLLLLIFIFLIIIIFNKQVSNLFSTKFKCSNLNFDIFIILGLLLISESLKKSLRFVCELAFLNKFVAITEICLIIFYVSSFWSIYFVGYQANLYLVFLPHLIQSIIGMLIFIYLIINKIYKLLPNNNENVPFNFFNQIVFNRFSNYINQLSHILFSGNFLIPFMSAIYGLEQISIFKLINVIAIYFTVILERTFGLTSGALLSHLKNFSKNVKQNALNLATRKLLIVLYAIIIFLIINSKNALYSYLKITNVSWVAIYCFLFAIIFENFFITIEQFFIVEGKVYYFVLTNLLAACLFYSLATFITLPLVSLLFLFIVCRISSFIALKEVLFKKLDINLNYKINIKYFFYFILFSTFFLILIKQLFELFRNYL